MYQAMLIYTWDPDLTLEFPNDVFLRHCDVGFDISGNDNLTFNVAHPYVCDVQTYVVTGDNTYYSPYDPPSAGDCDGDYDNDGMDDGWEMRNFGTTSQAPSGDFDGDGLSNLLEYQLGSDPAAADSDGDGLPDGWEYHWFGNFTHTGSELDASGNTLLYDYENYLDPNGIVFSVEVANNYVKESNAGLHLNVLAGVPSYYAVLVDSTNFRAATWTPYTSSDITANLGSLQGWHELWVGLKGCASNASEAWHWKRLKLDTIPPQLTITSPTNDIVDMPAIQLTGFSIEALRSLRYDLANAFGEVNNQQALVTSHYFDQNAQEFTANFFQAFDVSLAHGLNTITLHATDLAGNVANMTGV